LHLVGYMKYISSDARFLWTLKIFAVFKRVWICRLNAMNSLCFLRKSFVHCFDTYIYWFSHLEVHPVIFYLKYAFHFRLWTDFITFMLLSTTKYVITFACSSDSVLLATCELITRITKANHRAMSWLRKHVIAHVCPDHLECMEPRLHALITWFLNKGVNFKYNSSIHIKYSRT